MYYDGYLNSTKSHFFSPDWCGSVDWAPACKPKRHQFDSQSGQVPGVRARSTVGGAPEAITHWCISPSLPLFSRNKYIKSLKNKSLFQWLTMATEQNQNSIGCLKRPHSPPGSFLTNFLFVWMSLTLTAETLHVIFPNSVIFFQHQNPSIPY